MGEIVDNKDAAPERPSDEQILKASQDKLVDAGLPADFNQPKADADPNRPEWLPEKFNSAEDMAKAYSALETKQGEAAPEVALEVAKEEVSISQDSDKAEEPEVQATPASIPTERFNKYSEEFHKDGKISEGSYAELAKDHGISQDMVTDYIEGQKARVENYQADLLKDIGGKDKYNEISGWAGKNLSKDQLDGIQKTFDMGNAEQIKMSLKGLEAQYKAANNEPQLIQGKPSATIQKDVFTSNAQVVEAMGDPRYSSDPAYQRSVQEKLGRSKI